jgi:hypothetical protein
MGVLWYHIWAHMGHVGPHSWLHPTWPLYLGFVMLTSRAWFSSSRSCEPEFGMRSAVRVVNERTRGVAKSLWQVLADRYLPTSNCGQVPALAQVLAHVLVQVFARAHVLADKHLCSRKYLHTYLHTYLREHKYLPTRVCGQVLVLAQVLAQVLPQVLVRPDAAARLGALWSAVWKQLCIDCWWILGPFWRPEVVQ